MILTLHRQRQKDQDFQASLGYNATLSQTKTIREPSKTRAHQTSEWVCASMPAGHMLSLDQLGAHSWGRRARLPIYRGVGGLLQSGCTAWESKRDMEGQGSAQQFMLL